MIEVVAMGQHKWFVGWPYRKASAEQLAENPHRLYALPDAEHDELAEWWRERVRYPLAGCDGREQLLRAIDAAMVRRPPPHPFRLVRAGTGRLIAEYHASQVTA